MALDKKLIRLSNIVYGIYSGIVDNNFKLTQDGKKYRPSQHYNPKVEKSMDQKGLSEIAANQSVVLCNPAPKLDKNLQKRSPYIPSKVFNYFHNLFQFTASVN